MLRSIFCRFDLLWSYGRSFSPRFANRATLVGLPVANWDELAAVIVGNGIDEGFEQNRVVLSGNDEMDGLILPFVNDTER